ncbi:MAG: cell division protein ZipA C-terminal FtsZ-binding domain-containing protein [Candidatus Accumulibacter sp.]|jgi:hypothetical protein|nr:cell division protein ZipA C-terminal FtsZ-binding domain-containing protein [Accumulibacter sp.]
MTELQMGLIGLGVLAVGGVLAYNKWQEARQRKQAEDVLKTGHPDILFDDLASGDAELVAGEAETVRQPRKADALPVGEIFPVRADPGTDDAVMSGARVEPVLNFNPETEPGLGSGPGLELPESPVSLEPPMRAENEPAGEATDARQPAIRINGDAAADQSLLSPRIDFIAAIDTVEPVPAQRIIDATRETLSRISKPVRWIGYDEKFGEWRLVSGPGEYRRIQAGLQLVDRRGAVNEDELAIFATAMQDLADQLSGIADLPSRQSVFEAAQALDRFCASVDIQIGINVISEDKAFAGTKLRALAEAAGMAIDENGRFVRRDDDGNVLYVLLNQDTPGFSAETMRDMSTRGLTFLLDVPCVAHGQRVFNQMVDLARRFADVLPGALVDDNRRPLSETALEPVIQRIVQYQTMLADQRLPAGSPLTQRLFS